MIPIGDSPVARRTPFITYLLIAACIAVFLIEVSLGERFIRSFAVTPLFVTRALSGDPRVPGGTLWTLITSQFLHGGLLHLGGNMLFLWIFGDNVEDRFGHLRYLLFYLVCGIGAALIQVATDPTSTVPLVGASGAISGVLGAYVLFQPSARVSVLIPVFLLLWPVQVPALLMIGIWFLTQFSSGLAMLDGASDGGGVAYWAHVAGFVIGLLLAVVVPKARVMARGSYPSPFAMERGPVRLRRGAAGVLLGAASTASDVIQILLLARLVAQFLGAETLAWLEPLPSLLVVLTWPLVAPFSRLLPAVFVGEFVLELYTLLAIFAYQLFLGLLVRLLTSWLRYSHPASTREASRSGYPRYRWD